MPLSPEEVKIINRFNRMKEKARERQKRFRDRQMVVNPSYKEDRNKYMREYNANLRKKYNQISREEQRAQETEIKEVKLPDVTPIKISKRNRRGKKRKADADDVIPANHKRKDPLVL